MSITGVFLSGGMDSALLLYLVAKEAPSCIQPFTVAKHDGAALYVQPIIDWISKYLSVEINSTIFIGDPYLPHQQIVGDALRKVINHNLADIIYVGDNAYLEEELPEGPKRVKFRNQAVKYPLFDMTKDEILKMYVEHGIMDLLPLTHTCTEQAIGRCNICWQCRERAWAFEKCGIQDLTTT